MDDGDRAILDHFAGVRDATCELLSRVPEEMLGRRAEGEERPVEWLFAHIADGVDWWMHNVMHDGRGVVREYHHDRPSILRALRNSKDRLLAFFEAAGGRHMGETFTFEDADGTCTEFIGRERVLYLTAHEVHHRGKIVLALRQWGFKDFPPLP